MLKSLNIVNFALVQRLRVDFGEGLNILTGETGSGKSLLIDALGLIAGGRSSPEFIRSGESKGFVEAIFDNPRHPSVTAILEEAGFEVDDEELLIRREVTAAGKGRVFLNDQLCTVNLLRAIRPYLVDIHGQGEQQTLIDPSAHLSVLDSFGEAAELAGRTAELFSELRQVRNSIEAILKGEAERLRRIDMLNFQLEEIERVRPRAGEDTDLEGERARLANAERLAMLAGSGYELLYDREDSALSLMAQAIRRLEELSGIDGSAEEHLNALRSARYAVEEVGFFLRDYADGIVYSPERLREVDQRLNELDKLKRKYGPTIEAVLNLLENLRAELSQTEAGDAIIAKLEADARRIAERYRTEAGLLSAKRKTAAARFESALVKELKQLALEDARIGVEFRPFSIHDEAEWTAGGVESVEFLFTSNPGEPPRPLAKVASGGELSRLMLGIKTILAPTDVPRTMVFDEVDVGISGRVAEAVGSRLKRLSQRQQVLCITHQPQVARFGTAHYRVLKRVSDGRTQSEILRLSQSERVEELARMIGGAVVTDSARSAALEMLADQNHVGAPTKKAKR
jgi:DNA repair protein RecN (Recombination protein N)